MRHAIIDTLTRTLLACGMVAAFSTFAGASVQAQQGQQGQKRGYERHVPASLARHAKISEDSALKVAHTRIPNGTVSSLELEREDGHLMYSMDVKVPGKSGIEELNVDAVDGRVLAQEHESPEAEAKEARDEAGSTDSASTEAGSYHVSATNRLGGDGGWDYLTLDTASNRLFIARSDRVMVVDPGKGDVLGEITGLQRAHGVAFSYATGHGFATSGADSTVIMFDLATLKVLGRTMVDADDDGILYDPASSRILTMNGDANTASVIDAASGRRIGTIPLGGKPEFAVSDGRGKVYANLEDRGYVVELDPKAMKVTRRWSIAPCESPTGMAIDAAHARIFSVCRNRLMAISDAAAGKVIATVPIGTGVDAARFDPATGNAFASNGDGSLTVVHETAPDSFRVVQTLQTIAGARTMELDPASHRLYTVGAEFEAASGSGTAANSRPRPRMKPGSFTLLTITN
jgi:YVTN family beta-propeller protein